MFEKIDKMWFEEQEKLKHLYHSCKALRFFSENKLHKHEIDKQRWAISETPFIWSWLKIMRCFQFADKVYMYILQQCFQHSKKQRPGRLLMISQGFGLFFFWSSTAKVHFTNGISQLLANGKTSLFFTKADEEGKKFSFCFVWFNYVSTGSI